MAEPLGTLSRTHTCGALRGGDVGADVTLLGWVHRVRDLGAIVFVDVRDRAGLTQVIVRDDEALLAAAKRLRSEFVVAVRGVAQRRSEETINPKLATGEVEVLAREIRLLNEAKTPPFQIAEDQAVSEDVRLKYRYLDLRRPRLQGHIGLRHRVSMAVRRYFDANGFWEIETPILTKSTPEGARDFLVPSRVHPGEFYALPQSPQIFKQILMISGMDRYFQITRCFRDEDQRADRQLEFTQVDVEVSFARPETIYSLIEPLMQAVLREVGRDVTLPLRRMSYAEAMAKYGSDKPDLRFGLEIDDVSDLFGQSSFGVFREIVGSGGVVRGFVVPKAARYSRREVDDIVEQAKQLGATGLVWIRRAADGGIQTNVKAIGDLLGPLLERLKAPADGLAIVAAGAADATSKILGQLRLTLAKKENLIDANVFAFTWVTDFPLLEYHEEDGRWYSMHHPFTAPADEDVEKLESDPGAVRAKAYDLVLNGTELGGGSVRIHDASLQARIFKRLGITDEEAALRFGFFLEALQYGTPPHGGIALGLDRMVALLAGEASIREVIAFPKTTNAVDLMAEAPSAVDSRQLRELRLKVQA